MTAIYVEITGTRGSTPRDAGTVMKVTAGETTGTIGGGALEYKAIAIAREMLQTGTDTLSRNMPLGPDLGQCCGGAVTLLFTREPRQIETESSPVRPITSHHAHPGLLWVWGAGHVGRAIVRACPPQAFRITWVDDAADRFPTGGGPEVTRIPAADMPLLATRAPANAHHLIVTYSHDIDLALCAALLKRGAASIGLIGSDTKRTRFFRRLRDMGLDPAPITCPIGDKALGKRPRDIAHGTVTALLEQTEWKTPA